MIRHRWLASIAGATAFASFAPLDASAQQTYKIGSSVGLSGYLANIDRAWRDGLEVSVAHFNSNGGVLGRKIELVIEDNKSEPQEAVTVYRKMISSDKVDVFISGCVSAGTFAAAPFVVRAQIPMVLCSILPPQPDQVKWAYSMLPPPRFETEARYVYLKEKTQIKKVGILHDPSPYGILQKNIAEKIASEYGLEIIGVEQYKSDDADLSAQISKLNAAGAGAILKIGIGGSTVTAAKNVKQLGLKLLLMGGADDMGSTKPAGDELGPQFIFAAAPAQVFEALPDGPLKAEIAKFAPLWRAKFGTRDPYWGGKAWDALSLTIATLKKANSAAGENVRDTVETMSGFQGTGGVYNFSPTVHQGITQNPFVIGVIEGGVVKVKQP
jgi:branched-chain amino acid transport system substrate-binding protein